MKWLEYDQTDLAFNLWKKNVFAWPVKHVMPNLIMKQYLWLIFNALKTTEVGNADTVVLTMAMEMELM